MADKDKFIQIRVSETEKYLIQQQAKLNGFDSISAYILYLLRNTNK